MNELLSKFWWMLGLRGVIGIVFGVLALMWPNLTLLALIVLFAAYGLLTGAVAVIAAIKNRKSDDDWWLPLLLGTASVGVGIIAIVHPGLTAIILVLLMGANALVIGVLDIVTAIRLRKVMRTEWMLILGGIASIVFGALVFLFPAAGALALVWMIALYAIVTGVLLLAVAFRLRTALRGDVPNRRITADRRTSTTHAHS